jgi:hypothetical protein
MIDVMEKYECENCGRVEYSDCGSPFYGFEKGLDNMEVCEKCLKELENERLESEE